MLSKLSNLPPLAKIGLAALVVLVACAVVFAFLGPIWALGVFFASALIALLWLVLALILRLFKKRRADNFDRQLAGGGASKAEVDRAKKDLIDRWQSAMKVVKEANLSVYDVPWFMLIGEPQSGKSTTLLNSGIEFPLGKESLSGVGGTRNCDWWFANEAVILDTAGRFTFQERNAPDKDEWLTFLQLLRRHRSTCPVNGVIVVIPVTSLQENSQEVLEEKAQNIRAKLDNIQKVLEIQFPVFVLITKADHILGFTEFCGRLSVEEQRQLFGWSEQRNFEEPYNPATFTEHYQQIQKRLHDWRVRFLSEESAISEVDKLFTFPEEFQALGGPLSDYLRIVFQSSRYAKPLFFRGYYFTSGMQQGRPIAKACAQMFGREGAGSQAIESLESVFQKQKAFFIRDFYREKTFPEQGLIFRTPEALQRNKMLKLVTWVGGSILSVLVITLLTFNAVKFNRTLEPVRQTTNRVQSLLADKETPGPAKGLATCLEVSRRIQEIEGAGSSAVFFRGRKNVVSEDLHQIHRVLFEKTVLAPLLAEVGRSLTMTPAKGVPEGENYLPALKEYIRLLASAQVDPKEQERRLSGIDIGAMVSYYAATQGPDPGFSSADLEAEYQRYSEEGGVVPPVTAGDLDLAGAIRVLEAYWPVAVELEPYRQLVELTESIDRIYETLIGHGGSSVLLSYRDVKDYGLKLAEDLDLAGRLVEQINNSGFLLSSTNALYKNLQAEVDTGAAGRQQLANMLSEQSVRVGKDIETNIAMPLKKYEHLLLLGPKASDDAQATPELPEKGQAKKAIAGLAKELAEKAVKKIGSRTVIAALTPTAIDLGEAAKQMDQLFKQVDNTDQELTKVLAQASDRKAEDQAQAVKSHHDGLRNRIKEVLAKSTLRPAADASAIWLPTHFAEKLPGLLETGYNQYLKASYPFWLKVYQAFPLNDVPADSSSWSGFRNQPVFLRGQAAYLLNEPVDKLIDSLKATIPAELGSRVPEAAGLAEHLQWLETNRKRIRSDSEALVACLWELDDDPLISWQKIHDSDPKAVTSFSNLHSLKTLSQETAGRFPEDRVLTGLSDWSDRADSLLYSAVAQRLGKDWETMRTYYKRSVDGRFPFGGEPEVERIEGAQHNYKMQALGLNDAENFFTGDEGIGGIITQYRLAGYLEKEEDLPRILSGPQKDFVIGCNLWKNFLFDKDITRSHQIQVEYEPQLDDLPGVNAPAGKRFTRVRISAPGGFDMTFRPSSDKARLKSGQWNPQTAGSNTTIKIRGDNEDSGEESAYYLEAGPLALLTYIVSNGEPRRGRNRKEWIVKVNLPDPQKTSEMVGARVLFRFEQPLPAKP